MKKLKFKPILTYCKRARLELIIIAAVLFADLLSKFLISRFMKLGESVTLIKKFLSFYYTKNTAAAFSFDFGLNKALGENGTRIFFIILMSLATVMFIVLMIRGQKNHRLYRISFAMIIGGALGNLYDRIFHQAVRDFIRIEYFGAEIGGSPYFAIFNLADSSLVLGVGVFIVYFLFFFSKDEKAREEQKRALKAAVETGLSTDVNAENTKTEIEANTKTTTSAKAEISAEKAAKTPDGDKNE